MSSMSIIGILAVCLPRPALAKHRVKPSHRSSHLAGTASSEQGRSKGGAKAKAGRSPVAAKTKSKVAQTVRQEKRDASNAICKESYNDAKRSAQSGNLLEAKEFLGKCARESCGRFLQGACTALYTQMEVEIPSIVPVVTDASPAQRGLIAVKMDGEPFASKIDGRAILLNPGDHEFSFSTENRVFATQQTLVVQGQRNRTISVSLQLRSKRTAALAKATAERVPEPKAAEPKAAEPEADDHETVDSEEAEPKVLANRATAREGQSEGGASWLAYTLGGVGLAGLGSAALLDYWGRKDNRDLTSMCLPDCNPESVHHVRLLYLAADVSLGVGVAALVASTWLFVRSPSSEKKSSTGMAIRVLDVQPTPSGALATVGGIF